MPSEPGRGRGGGRFADLARLAVLAALAALLSTRAVAASSADDLAYREFPQYDYASVRSAVLDAIEGEGLVPSPPLDFAEMLARTAPAIGQPPPLQRGEILQFCSAKLAFILLGEDPAQLALCPLAFNLGQAAGQPHPFLSWRLPAATTPGRAQVRALYQRLLSRVIEELP
ncbi:DUF302 domain-containing protein [Dechloromonas sp. ZY10]|uniref:DUF302 domain-containing protein n=1 Tax=Dechloromonas aquae TaxID=2664436 RepID=UPI003528A61C